MITIACIKCHLALRTTGDFNEVDYLVGMKCEWYPDKYPCPRSGCNGKMTLTDVIESSVLELLEVHDLTPQECWQAFQGLGLPAERACTPEAVADAMQASVVISVDMQAISNDKRTIIHSILLGTGVRVYLASSPQGAMVYRIAQPRSVVQEVLNGQ